jgi:hypothetical protein
MAAKRGSENAGGQGNGNSFRGGEFSTAAILDRALTRLEQALGQLIRHAADLQFQNEPLLPLDQARARTIARALSADVRGAAVAADQARRAAGKLFTTEVRGASPRERAAATRQFAVRNKWCATRIAETRQGLLVTISRALYWNARFQKPSELLFPRIPLPPPHVELVWNDFQRHNIQGVSVPVRKTKFDIVIFGIRLNFALVSFPHLPDWEPKPKLLVSSGQVTAHGVTLHALDTIGTHVGNPVLPATSHLPAVNFSGYMKIIYATDIPAGCEIKHKTVAYESVYLLPNGALAWKDISPLGMPGQPRPDPPEGGPDNNVAPGTTALVDFPGNAFPPETAVCAYLSRNSLFRTWVLLVCPDKTDKTTVLGYWQWSFRYVLHLGKDGAEPVAIPAGNNPGPGGVPAPPGGWPEQSSGPTSWVPAESAPAEATNDYKGAFPGP